MSLASIFCISLGSDARASKISNEGWAFEMQCCMAYRIDWHLPVQEETDQLGLKIALPEFAVAE